MKKHLVALSIMLALTTLSVYSQQAPLYSQYYINPFMFNPARAGQNEQLQAFGIYRKQWADFSGAPETRMLTLDGALKSGKIGLGGTFFSETSDIMEHLGGSLSYAYYIKINDDNALSIGVTAQMFQSKIDFNRLVVDDPTEEIISRNLRSSIGFDAAAGVNYRFKGLNVGVAVPNLVQTNLQYLNNQESAYYQLARHYFAHASYKIPVVKNVFYIEPNAFFRMAKGKAWQIEGGAMLNYKDIVWVNGAYRHDYGASVGGGFMVHQRVGVGYAYDIPVNEIKSYTNGSHDFFVSVRFGKRDDKQIKNIMNQIDTIRQQNDSIFQLNQNLSEKVEQQQQTIEELNQKVDQQQRTIQEMKEMMQKEVEKLLMQKQQELDSIKNASPDTKHFDSKGRPLPKELIEEVGDWGNIEFIYGKSDDPYFLIAASARKASAAKKYAQDIEKKGHKAGVVYNTERDWYYVFLEKPGDFENGLKTLYELRKDAQFKDAWIHIYK